MAEQLWGYRKGGLVEVRTSVGTWLLGTVAAIKRDEHGRFLIVRASKSNNLYRVDLPTKIRHFELEQFLDGGND